MKEVVISKATIHDHGALIELLCKWFDEALAADIPGPCIYSGIWLADLIAKHVVIVAKIQDKIVGGLGLRATHFPWNNEVKIFVDDFLMTCKEHRQYGVADKLLYAAKAFAKEFKHILVMGHFSGRDPELKDKYLSRKHGFEYLGGNFIYKGE